MGRSRKIKNVRNMEAALEKRSIFPGLQLLLICAAIFLAPVCAGSISQVGIISVQLMVFIAAFLWIAQARDRGSIGIPVGLTGKLIGILSCLLLLSIIGSVSVHATLSGLGNWLSYFLLFLMLADMKDNPKRVYMVAGALVFSGMIVGALGVKEYLESFRSAGSDWRVFSTFFNPDYFAGFLVLVIPIALCWFLSETSGLVSVIMAVTGLLCIGSLMLTGSRFGALAGFGGIAFALITAFSGRMVGRAQKARLLIILVPAVLAAGILAKPLLNKLSAAHGVKAESHSMSFRLYTWQGTMKMAEANFIKGTGLGTFELAYPKYASVGYTRLAHDSYLQVAAESGPVAGVLLVVFLVYVFAASLASVVKRRADEIDENVKGKWYPDRRLLLAGLIGGIAASLLRNAVDSDWYITGIGMSFWVMLGILVGLTAENRVKNMVFTPSVYAVSAAILGIAVVMLSFGLGGAVYTADGDAASASGDVGAALESYKQASTLDMFDPQSHLNLGSIYLSMAQRLSNDGYAKRAERELQNVIRLSPTNAVAYYRIAKVYDYMHDEHSAIRALQTGLKYDPHSPKLLNLCAELMSRNGQEKDALGMYRLMTQIEESPYEQVRAVPEYVEPLYIFARAELGRAEESKGNKPEAVQQYKRALDRIKRYQDSEKVVGRILDASNRRDASMEARVVAITDDLVKRMDKLSVK